MLLGAGWCSMAIPNVPFVKDGLSDSKWKHVVMRAGKIIDTQQQLLAEDQKSIAVLQSVLASLPSDGQKWAKLLINRLEFRVLYLKATLALNRAFITYDQVAVTQGIQPGAKAAKLDTSSALKLAAEAIEKYADDVRNRGDLGVIGQLNVQFYDIISQLDNQFRLDSPYITLNWKALRMNVGYQCDFVDSKCWPLRDGVATIAPFVDEGIPSLRVSLAGTAGAKWGSCFIRRGVIDLDKQPLMDFYLRTNSRDAVALMFQVEGKNDTWFQLDIIGMQKYRQLDRINPAMEINNGQWQRITWNLQKLVAELIGPDIKSIKNLVVGTWNNPTAPVVLEFKKFCFGSFNQLDGLEVDQ